MYLISVLILAFYMQTCNLHVKNGSVQALVDFADVWNLTNTS